MPKLSDPPPEGAEANALWPYFRVPKAGQIALFEVPAQMLPVLGQKVAFAYALLPKLGRVLALKHFSVLSGGGIRTFERYLGRVYEGGPTLVAEKKLLSEYFPSPDSQDGGESNAMRQLRRAVMHAALLTAQLNAIQSASDTFFKNNAALAEGLELPAAYQGASPRVAGDILDLHLLLFVHVSADNWVLKPVGWKPADDIPTSSGSNREPPGALSSLGIQFLSNQLRDRDSKYRMPIKRSAQRQWEDWFDRISGLQVLYPGLSAQLIITALLGHISVDDERVMGWAEISKETVNAGNEIDLQNFLSHVRKQVLPVGTNRKQAAQELHMLSARPHLSDDCQSLGLKIQQLFIQLFPVSSTESEPMTRLNAMRLIHRMLENLKNTAPSLRSKSAQSWSRYDEYSLSGMFHDYLDEKLHSSTQESVRLCTQYLGEVCQHLNSAHTIQVQLSQANPPSENRVQPHNASAFGNRSNNRFTPRQPTRFTSSQPSRFTSSQPTRFISSQPDRSTSYPAGRRSRDEWRRERAVMSGDRHRSPGPPGLGGGRNARSRSAGRSGPYNRPSLPGSSAPLITSDPVKVQAALDAVYARMPEGQKPGQIRSQLDSNLQRLSRDQVMQAILDRACILCQQQGHSITRCPLFRGSRGDLHNACVGYKQAFFEVLYAPQ